MASHGPSTVLSMDVDTVWTLPTNILPRVHTLGLQDKEKTSHAPLIPELTKTGSEIRKQHTQSTEQIYWSPQSQFNRKFRCFVNNPISKGFVRASACCSFDSTCRMMILFWLTSSRKKWWRTSMCVDVADISEFFASLIASCLSSRTSIAFEDPRGRLEDSTPCRNNASFTPSPIPTDSDLEVDIVTQRCALDDHDTQAPPHMTATPDTECRCSDSCAKFESA